MLGKETQEILLQKRDRELKGRSGRGEEARTARSPARDAEPRPRGPSRPACRPSRRAGRPKAPRAGDAEQAKNVALLKELADLKGPADQPWSRPHGGRRALRHRKAEVAAGGLRSIDKLAEFLKKIRRAIS